MTLEQVLHKFSRTQVTTSIGILALLASGSIELSAPKPTPRGMHFQPEKALDFSPVGAGATAFNMQQPRPTAMASADFDVDGVKDLAIGYALNKGGQIAIMRGNLDAIAPQSKESWTNTGFGRYADAFLPQANMIPVPVEPDQLITADVNGDGNVDLVFAANNGNAIYVLAGNGKGQFKLQLPVTVNGTITALAAHRTGGNNGADALVVGVKTSKGFAAELYRKDGSRFAMKAGYAMPGAVTAIATANLDNDLTPDAALIAGGQVVVLQGAGALVGKVRLETLPVSDAVSLTSGTFLFDRHAGMQLAVLTSDGTAHFFAHDGFDPRPFTTQEITAARRNAMRHENGPTLAQMAGNTGNAPWTEVETLGGVAPAGFTGTAPVLLRARAAGSGQDDVLAVNSAQQQIAIVRHPATASSALHAVSGVVMRSPLTSSDVVAAIAQRVSPLGMDGIVMLKRGSPRPEITTPAQSNTMFVNTTTDSLDANDTARCTSGSAETCSLRDAITYANADAGVNITGGTSDTIEIPAGTYPLTYNAGTTDANNNAVTHLEILGPMTLVGDPSGVTIDAQSKDVVFTINPGPYGSYNPSGDSYVFDTTFENLTITGGQNFNNPANSSTGMPNNVGSGINWDADGTGNLTLTNCTVNSNTNGWGDGGGIWFFNSASAGTGTLTLSGGSVSNNSTSEIGGGIYQATAPAGFSAIGVAFAGNTASPNVNTNDPGGASGADDAGAIYLSAVPGGSGIPSATISGGSITGNSADGDGGGVYTTQGISITGGTNISNNSATGSGGGIFHNADATTTVAGANIASNSATNTGGGITVGTELASNGNAFTIANSRIFGNTSSNGASGLSVGEPSSTGAGAVTATENWWGCNAGPTTAADGCDQAVLYDSTSGSLSATPNIVLTLGVSPNPVNLNSALQLDASVNTDSSSGTVPGGPGALDGLSVTFSATVGAFSDTPSAAIDGTGNATTSVTPSSSGLGSATATLDNQTVTQNFTVTSGAPAITSASSAAFTAGTAGSFTVTTTGNPTPALSETGALPAGVNFVDNGNGTASIVGTAILAGSYPITITAQNGVAPAATQSFILTVNPGPATYLVIPGGPEPFYTAFGFSIYAYDAENNLATSYNGTVAFTSSDPGFVNLGPVTLVNGVGSQTGVLKTAGTDTITATDITNPSITGTGSFTIQPGVATHIGVAAPASTYAGSPISVTVSAYDLYGNLATSYGGTVAFTSTDPLAVLPGSSAITNGTGTFTAYMETAGTQTITATDAVNSLVATSGGISVTIPNLVVTTAADDAGAASNCTIQTTPGTGTDASCSLRDALLFAANQGAGSITFDSTKFAAAKTISLTNGTLTIPTNTSVIGPTTGSGASLTNLVTVDGGGASNNFPVFTTTSSGFNAVIQNLIITDGGDGGVYNGYAALLTIQNSTVSGNNSAAGTAGVFDDYNASVTIIASTISGNTGAYGAIVSEAGGTITVSESTISGNSSSNPGGAILSDGNSVTVSNSTITGNSAYSGGGIAISGGTLSLTDSIVAANTVSTTDPDISGTATDGGYNFIGDGTGLTGITNGSNGDQVGTSASPLNPMLAPLGSFGGPTQTMIPLPGSSAICAINPSSATGTDQRGFPITTTYNATTCQDIGAVETNYALSFTTNPAATETTGVSFPVAVTLTESGGPVSGVSIPVTLAGGGTLTGSPVSATTNASGVASYTLTVSNSTALSNLTLTATLPSPPSIMATSSDFALSLLTPTVTGVSPNVGPQAGGTAVTITGSNLTGATAVNFGVTPATSFTDVSPTSIIATSSAGTGTVDVTVITANGTSATTAADQFTYLSVGVTASPISATAGTAFSGPVASLVDDTGNAAPATDFTATIAWGDGTTSAGTISQPGGVGTPYVVSGTHTYVTAGPYTFTVNINSALFGTATSSSTATVVAGTTTQFMVAAPSSASLDGAFNFTVTAFDAFNNTTTGYTGTVHFTSTDPSALLPADSTLTNGVGTFSATLNTSGSQRITATDTTTSTITGTSGSIAVAIPVPGTSSASLNFGSVAVGSTSVAQTLDYAIASGTTVGSIGVLTQGANGLDFANATGSTCTANTYATATDCTVNVTFAPMTAGYFIGAVVFSDAGGSPITTVPISGTGVGPQVNFLPGKVSTLGSGFSFPFRVATDSSGDVFVSDSGHNEVKEIVAVGGKIPASPTIRTLASGLSSPLGLAVDGSGDVYFADSQNMAVKEIVAVDGAIPASPTIRTLSTNFNNPDGVAVDAGGNVFVSDAGGVVKEFEAVGGVIPASPSLITLASFGTAPQGLALDSSGDIFVLTYPGTAVSEIVAVNGSIPASPSILTLGSGLDGAGGLAVNANGSLIIADTNNNAVKEFVAVGGSVPASPTILTLGSGFSSPGGVALDGSGNVYVADISNNAVKEIDLADSPSLSFATTNVGLTSTDSPQTVEVEDAGNAELTFTGLSYPTDFPELSGGGTNPCTGATSLNGGETCNLNIDFSPQSATTLTENVTLSDNSLNITSAQQSIQVNGLGTTSLSVTANPISSVATVLFSGGVATFTNVSNTAPLADFTATINWGDGSAVSAGTIAQPGGTGTAYAVTGAHTYAAKGSYAFTVTVNSTVFGTASGTGTATVAPTPATHFMVTAPASANLGGAFNFTVTALDALNNATSGYTGTVHFTSTDPNAVLPADSTLVSGSGTLSATLMTVGSQTIIATDTTTASITGTTGNISVTIPSLVVENTNDSGAGSLRKALNDAAAEGSGNITFDPTVFATAQTITLTSGTLNIPANTTVTGTGASLLAIDGNQNGNIFEVAAGVTAKVSNLTLQNALGVNSQLGGAVYNAGTLTISGVVVQNSKPSIYSGGAALYNDVSGSLSITTSTISGNGSSYFGGSSGNGGGIYNAGGNVIVTSSTVTSNEASHYGGNIYIAGGTITIANSTITGGAGTANGGAIAISGGSITATDSTISGNFAQNTGGIYIGSGTVTLSNTILAGNSDLGGMPDGFGAFTDGGHNLIGVSGAGSGNTGFTATTTLAGTVASPLNPNVAPLGNYGGPTQTMVPLPGSVAICSINPSAATGTDQRSMPRTTTYGATTCQDEGAVQTNYALNFSSEPPATVTAATNFSAGVTLLESGGPFVVTATPLPTVTIPLTLNGSGNLTGGSTGINDATGIATYSGLQVDQNGNDTLTANLTLNPNFTPTALSISATSSSFTVEHAATTTVASSATAVYSATPQNVALTATVTSTAGTVNGGTMTFTVLQGSTPIGSAVTGSVTDGSATASYAIPGGTPGGTYTIYAVYNGTVSYATSSDNTHTLTLTQAETTTAATNTSATFSASAQSVTLSATVTSPSGTVNAGTVTFTVLQGSMPVGTAVTSATVSNGSASVSYTLPAGTAAGTYSIKAVYSGTASLTTSSENSATLNIGKATATITLGNLTQTYTGSPLSATAITAPTGLTVNFTYNGSPNPPTIAGSYAVVGTISDANYQGSATGTLKINQATPTISWPAPAAINYGTALSATQLDATATFNSATVPGALVYTPPANTVLTAGTDTLSVTFTPTDTTDFTTVTQTVQIKVNQATPTITWPAPAAITYGTALSATQLDATASFNSTAVAGAFVYTPAAGTVLSAGSHTLSVTFTPTDTTDYSTPGPATTTITVNSATLDVTVNSATKVYGTANPVFTGNVTGTQNSDSFTESFTTTATISSNVGSYPIVPSVTGADLSDYTQVVTDGTLTITQAASTTSLIASATSITPGEPLTLTATVASTTTGTPTGTVTFFDNTIPLGTVTLSAGVASYTTSALAPGIAHKISATYSGDMNFTASSTTAGLTITVAPLEFTLTVNGADFKSVYPGSTTTYTLDVAPLYGSYAGTMNFAITGLPSGVTAAFSPDSIPANGGAQAVTLTISDAALSSAASPPTGLPKQIVPIVLALLLLPLVGARRMRQNGRRMRNVFYVLVLGCSALSATLLSGCGSANGFFAQAPKNYNLTITATAGSVQKSATVTLDVQ